MSEQITESVNLWETSLVQFVSHCRIAYRSIHNNPRYVSAVVALADKLDDAEQSRDINHAAAKLALDQRDALSSLLNEAARMIEGYKRAGWLTNSAAAEQATDFIERVRSSITTNGKQPPNGVAKP
jgi:hypothetical protein